MYEMAKSAREKLKAKARMLAAPGALDKDQDTTQASWSPAEPLNADVKTGARPVGKARLYNKGGKVSGDASRARADRKPRKAGGKVASEAAEAKKYANAKINRDVRAANEEREGIKHVGGFKKGGRTARATGGSVPSDKETQTNRDRVGTIQVKPKRGAAEHYKKGGKVGRAMGGKDPSYVGSESVTERGRPVMRPRDIEDKRPREPKASDLYSTDQMKRLERGYKKGGKIKKADGGILDTIANALAGRGYIDGSTWMKSEPVTASDSSSAPMPPRRPKAANIRRRRGGDKLTPDQYSREMAMAYENEQPTIRGSVATPVQSERFMKKGGKIKKANGGSLPSPEEAIGSEERLKGLKVMPGKSATSAAQVTPAQLRREEGYAAADMKAPRAGRKSGGGKWIQKAIEKPGALRKALKVKEGEKIPAKKLEAAAEKGGKLGKRARLAQTLGRLNRATGGSTLLSAMKGAAKKVSKKGGKTNINIVINAGKAATPRPEGAEKPMMDRAPPMPPMDMGAPPAPPMGDMGAPGPMPPMPMGGVGAPPPAAILGRKAGGRITKVASSYKDMEAGAVSGEGRLQKTDIAKHHRDAPARKAGGRISKVAKSYKDMTAGAGDGEGRLQKTDIAKAKKARDK